MSSLLSFRSLTVSQIVVWYSLLVSVLVCICAADTANNSSMKIDKGLMKELTLTKSEKIALEKLKSAIPPDVPLEYLKIDLFLIRWLRAKRLNVDRTLRDIHELIAFREKILIKDFLTRDWSDVFPEKPIFSIDGVDREGRPFGYVSSGDGWDIRRLILEGKRDLISRYIINIVFELLEGRLLQMNREHANITQFVFLFNYDGFNVIQHACPLCIPTYLSLLQVYERFLPGFAHDIVFINTPSFFPVLVDAGRPVLTGSTIDVLRPFGTNKKRWKTFLDKIIDPAQLPWEFGGTKVTD